MAETMLDLRRQPKARAYAQLHAHVLNVLAGVNDEVAGMATISALTHEAFRFLWTGFYRVVGSTTLRVGPYQGFLGCLEIQFGKGVCGVAAAERRTVIVPDVAEFPGHIVCDSRARSEIVIPVFDEKGRLIAVMDVDSDKRGTFDEDDARGLERIVSWFAGQGRS